MVQKYRIFLCHASEDKAAVRDLYRSLRADGFQPWLDEEDLLPGQDWPAEIRKAIANSLIVLVCLSNQSVTKAGVVQKEIRIALDVADEQPEGTIFLIPVRLDNCAVPERLRSFQWVDLFDKKGYEKLVKSLHFRTTGKHRTEKGFDFTERVVDVLMRRLEDYHFVIPIRNGVQEKAATHRSGYDTTLILASIGFAPETFGEFLDKLIEEKHHPNKVDPDLKEVFLESLYISLDDFIAAKIIAALSDTDVLKFEQLLKERGTREEIQRFVTRHVPNLFSFVTASLTEFREVYLGLRH